MVLVPFLCFYLYEIFGALIFVSSTFFLVHLRFVFLPCLLLVINMHSRKYMAYIFSHIFALNRKKN